MLFGKKQSLVGLDIGSHTIKAVELEASGNSYRLTNWGISAPLAEAIVDGEIMDRELVIQAIMDCAEQAGLPDEPVASAVSGRAVIGGFSINHQQWLPSFPPPYVIAIVEIEEAPYVRLTTNIVGCDPADVRIGMPVEVVFEPCEDTYLPLFQPVKT